MRAALDEFYPAALARHLAGPSEQTLEDAYRLGRQALSSGVTMVQLSLIHHEALGRSPHPDLREAGTFLIEALGPYQMLQNAFREHIRELTAANETIKRLRRERSVFLAEASRLLPASLDVEQTIAAAVGLAAPKLARHARVELETALDPPPPSPPRGRRRPLRVGERTLGTLVLDGQGGLGLPAEEARSLELAFAERVALALDAALRHRELRAALELRDEFLAVAAHELKTPLTPLSLGLDSLGRMLRAAGLPLSTLERSQRQVRRLTTLVQELLDVTRIQSGRFELESEPVDLAQLVDDVFQLFTQARKVDRLSFSRPPEPVRVMGDRFRLEQVVTNLVDNALKYGAPGGGVRAELEPGEGRALLRVIDQGIGVPPAQKERIFEPFFRADNAPVRHYGGVGLGLHICREVVQRHGGRIWVEDNPAGGSVFEVELPLLEGGG